MSADLPEHWSVTWAARKAEAQRRTHVHLFKVPFARKPYGPDHPNGGPTCRDCGVERGQLHVPSCCMERCPICTGQAIGCGCADDDTPQDSEDEAVPA